VLIEHLRQAAIADQNMVAQPIGQVIGQLSDGLGRVAAGQLVQDSELLNEVAVLGTVRSQLRRLLESQHQGLFGTEMEQDVGIEATESIGNTFGIPGQDVVKLVEQSDQLLVLAVEHPMP